MNNWMTDGGFSLNKLLHVTRYAYQGTFLTKCDNKSGYDHILLTASSQRSFGMQLGGWWLINNILQFGWKESTFIYHSTGLVVSSFTQDLSILSSLYIKERLNGKFSTCKEPWSLPFSQ